MEREDMGLYMEGAILYVLSEKYPNGADEEQISEAIGNLKLSEQIKAHEIGMRLKEEGYGQED